MNHTAELRRVSEKIAELVIKFFNNREGGDQFTVNELTKYVMDKEPVAPDSPARIMRLLRRKGVINYEVVSRSRSLYRVVASGQGELFE